MTDRFKEPLSHADWIMLKTGGGSPYRVIPGTLPEMDFFLVAFACGIRLVIPKTHEEQWTQRNDRFKW